MATDNHTSAFPLPARDGAPKQGGTRVVELIRPQASADTVALLNRGYCHF